MTEQVETIEAGVESNGVGLRRYQIDIIRVALERYIRDLEENIRYHEGYLQVGAPLVALSIELREAKHLVDIFPETYKFAKDETGQEYGILWSIMRTYYTNRSQE